MIAIMTMGLIIVFKSIEKIFFVFVGVLIFLINGL